MLPSYSITSYYSTSERLNASELDSLCAALDEITFWSKNINYEFDCWFADSEKSKTKDELVYTLLTNDRFFNRLRRFVKREQYDASEVIKSISKIANEIPVEKRIGESTREFAKKALIELDINTKSNFHAMGGSPDNYMSIMFNPAVQGYSLKLSLGRFEKQEFRIQCMFSSTDAYENKELRKIGDNMLEQLKSNTNFI